MLEPNVQGLFQLCETAVPGGNREKKIYPCCIYWFVIGIGLSAADPQRLKSLAPPMALALVPEYPSTVPLIELTNAGFTPADSAITAGQSVTFHNSTSTPHMLIGDGFLRETSTLFLPFVAKNGAAANASVQNSGQQLVAGTGQNSDPLVNTCQFQVSLPPGAEYTHEYSNAGACHVYLTTAVHTANIAVNSANGPASLTGRVLDTTNAVQGNEQPVVGAAISLLGTGITAVTDNQGYFTLNGIAPADEHVLDINTTNAQPASDGAGYAGFREKIEIVAGIVNVVDRPLDNKRFTFV